MSSSLHDSPLRDSPLHDSPLHDSHLHDSLQLDSNEFCTTLRLPGRVYEAGEPPDNPKAIIHYSKIYYVEKKPYLWMLGKDDKFTVRTLYEMFKEKARSKPTLERVSLGTTIITEAVIVAENSSFKIPRDRLQRYMNYRLPKVAWGKTAYSILMRSVKSLSASFWTEDSYEVSGFALAIKLSVVSTFGLNKNSDKTEVLEMEKINNVEVSTVIGLAEEYKHLVGATHSNDADFHSVLDSNEFCTTLRLHGRLYEAGEPPDNPKAIIHHSNIDYVEKVEDKLGKEEFSLIENSHIGSILKVVKRSRVQFSKELFHFLMQRRVLTQGEDLWFTFSDQLMRFSLREFHLTTGLRCEEDQTITEPQFKIMKKPYLWMLGKDDKFMVRTLYEMFKEKARSMPTLERVSLGTAIITEAVIMAENPSSKIQRDRLQRYMNYRLPKVAWSKTAYSILMRSVKNLSASSWTGDSYEVSGFALAINLWAMSSVHVLGKSLGKSCETSSSSDPLCLHWDSTRTPTITEVLELEKINNVEVSTMIGLAEEYKHLVGATHSNDVDFHIVVKLVQQGYKMKRSDWEQGFVDMFVATEDIGQQRKTKDEDAEHCEDLNHSEDEEEKKNEEYQKDKEQRKDKDHSMSNSEKLDKLIQMVRNLDKRVVVIQNVLGVKFNDSSPNKKDCENEASSGDRRTAQDYENEEDTIDEEANSGDKKSAPDDGNEEDTFAEEANSGDGRSALDDENEEEICDEEAKSGTEHLREEENNLGENETTQKITQDEDT
ncbi:hypothetical protein F2Q69_00034643 [Brassica cretica]|uniref:DUF1985 domain-containing protein n=1 Tax=Brassica cretica TaxID=69181 RepID=A0A8S9SR57_BRACR|nr:hypothetical protein F2Q69_00034643 [Brassica cretica]